MVFDFDKELTIQILDIFQTNYHMVEVPFLRTERLLSWLDTPQSRLIKQIINGADESTVDEAAERCIAPPHPNAYQKKFTRLPREVETAFSKLRENCLAHTSVNLWVVSAYRSPAYQAVLILGEYYRQAFDAAKTSKIIMPPGKSEHGSALNPAVDISDAGYAEPSEKFIKKAYPWLESNASQFGFKESYPKAGKVMTWEPWHWRLSSI